MTGKLTNTKTASLFTLQKITAFVHVKLENFSCQKSGLRLQSRPILIQWQTYRGWEK